MPGMINGKKMSQAAEKPQNSLESYYYGCLLSRLKGMSKTLIFNDSIIGLIQN